MMDEAVKNALLVSAGTENRFFTQWADHQLINLLSKERWVSELYGKYTCPAIIVAGGPSLEKQIDTLRECQGKAVIIACGTAALSLHVKGITPTYIMCVDPIYENINYCKPWINKVPMITNLRTHPDILTLFKGNQYRFLGEGEFLSKRFYKDAPCMGDTVTVTGQAIQIAFNLGCAPVILIGQDLCYYGDKSHAFGVFKQKYNSHPIPIKDINGEDVNTDEVFQAMKYCLNNIASQSYGVVVNCTEGGLGIEGAENRPFKEVCQEWMTDDVDFVHHEIIEPERIDQSEFFGQLLDDARWIKEKIGYKRSLLRICENNESFIPEIKRVEEELYSNKLYFDAIYPSIQNMVLVQVVEDEKKQRFRIQEKICSYCLAALDNLIFLVEKRLKAKNDVDLYSLVDFSKLNKEGFDQILLYAYNTETDVWSVAVNAGIDQINKLIVYLQQSVGEIRG
jgi:hypothetical protein